MNEFETKFRFLRQFIDITGNGIGHYIREMLKLLLENVDEIVDIAYLRSSNKNKLVVGVHPLYMISGQSFEIPKTWLVSIEENKWIYDISIELSWDIFYVVQQQGRTSDENFYGLIAIKAKSFPNSVIKFLKDYEIGKIFFNQLAKMRQELSILRRSYFDERTGALNLRGGNELFNKIIQTIQIKTPLNPIHYFKMDLNYFGNINNKFGHDIGDNILKNFILILQQDIFIDIDSKEQSFEDYLNSIIAKLFENTELNGFVVRVGGDEFELYISGETKNVIYWLQNSLLKFSNTNYDVSVYPTASVGGIIITPNISIQNLTYQADASLYTIKRYGLSSIQSSKYNLFIKKMPRILKKLWRLTYSLWCFINRYRPNGIKLLPQTLQFPLKDIDYFIDNHCL